ncbi:MAG TPA: response regulator [Candidatus Sulfotelmatobacter sp.]|nr:response regulator [Candidatus Sulfotelmatobacter sp.]
MQIIVCTDRREVEEAVAETFDGAEDRQTVCESGMELLAVAKTLAADLLVLDLETPGLNGLLLVSALQELAPKLPVVAVTTKADTDARSLAQKGVRVARLAAGNGFQPPLAEIGRSSRQAAGAGAR